MPFERVQTLLADSTYHSLFKNTAQSFRYVWTNHGFTELYRGLTPILLRNGPSNAMFFVLREEAAHRLPQYVSCRSMGKKSPTENWRNFSEHFQSDPMAQTAQEFTSGAIIGAVTSSIFYPFNVVKVSMQSTMGTTRISMWTAFMNVYRERGSKIANVYKGCTINCTRAFISWGIMNTAYEHMKKLLYNFQHVRWSRSGYWVRVINASAYPPMLSWKFSLKISPFLLISQIIYLFPKINLCSFVGVANQIKKSESCNCCERINKSICRCTVHGMKRINEKLSLI